MRHYLIFTRAGLALAVVAGLALGGCANMPTFNLGSQASLNTIEGVVSGYGVVLNAEIAYKSLPLCRTGSSPSLTNICAKRSVIVRLQSADRIANSAVNNAVAFVKANPTVDPSQYIAAAQSAIAALQAVLNSASPTG